MGSTNQNAEFVRGIEQEENLEGKVQFLWSQREVQFNLVVRDSKKTSKIQDPSIHPSEEEAKNEEVFQVVPAIKYLIGIKDKR